MQENEFEKQVKNRMEEFQLPPLDTAWEKVSRKINEDKRKKRYFIFLLFFGLMAAGVFGYFISEKNTQKLNADLESKENTLPKNNNNNIIVLADSIKNAGKKTVQEKAAASINSTSNNATGNIKKQSINATPAGLSNNKKNLSEENKFNKNIVENATRNKSSSTNNKHIAALKNNNDGAEVNQQPQSFGNKTTAENNDSLYKDSAPSKPNVIIDNPPQLIANNKNIDSSSMHIDSIKNIQAAKTTSVKKQEKKSLAGIYKIPNWQWGINVMYGRSGLAQNITASNKSSFALTGADSTAGATIDSFHNKPYTSSSAYGFGVVLQKKILKNAVVGVGLNYEHLSVKSPLSNVVNPGIYFQYNNSSGSYLINNYYRPGNTYQYNSTYNFIELPLYFQQDIFHANKISFSYNAGFSVRQLLSAKAIIYNQSNGIYYFKDELLSKTQWQLRAGFNIKFNTGKSTALYMGPQFSYSLSNNFKKENTGSFHFINYGLQAGLLLHKK